MNIADELPRLTIGDVVRFDGEDYKFVAVQGEPGQPISLRLRGPDGTAVLVAQSELYEELTAAQSDLPSRAPYYRRESRDDPTVPEVDLEPEFGYIGKPYRLEAGSSNQLSDDVEVLPETALAPSSRYNDGRLTIEQLRASSQIADLDDAACLEGLDLAEQQRVQELQAHILEVLTGFKSGTADKAEPGEPRPDYDPSCTKLGERELAKVAELNVSRATFFRDLKRWRTSGIWGLVDKRRQRTRKPLYGLEPEVVLAAIRLSDVVEVGSSTGDRTKFKRHLEALLAKEKGLDTYDLGPYSTVMPKISKLLKSRHTFDKATTRRSAALSPDRTFVGLHASRPGQVVLLDATRIEVDIYDPERDVNVTYVLTLAIDLYTRVIMAYRFVPKAQNRADVVMLLLDMLCPEAMRPYWREAISVRRLGLGWLMLLSHNVRLAGAAAHPPIWPESVIIDHGKEYDSDAFDDACYRLGINVFDARKVRPTDKPEVEAIFRRIRLNFAMHCAGYKGPDTVSRGPLAGLQSRWTVAEYEEFFAEYRILYHQTPHGGLPLFPSSRRRMTPLDAYAEGVARCGWMPAPVEDTLYFELLPIKWRVLGKTGFSIGYRTYDDDILRSTDFLAPTYRPPLTKAGRRRGLRYGQRADDRAWPVHIDPRDVLHAYIFNPVDSRWYALRWAGAPDMLEPFTEMRFRHVRELLATSGYRKASEREIGKALLALQMNIDAPGNWLSATPKEVAYEAARSRQVKRDQATAVPLANATLALAQKRDDREKASGRRFDVDPSQVPSTAVISFRRP